MTALSRIHRLQTALDAAMPNTDLIRRIVIVGGGSAGWMAAAALSNVLGSACQITLVESDLIGTVGVGEATIPTIRLLNQTMGIDEKAFLRQTQGTFKLGIEFVDWGHHGKRYFHPFGTLGMQFDPIPVHQHFLKHRLDTDTGTLDDYSLACLAARQGRFALPTTTPQQITSSYNYAFHFDATLYAQYLRQICEARGVQRMEGKIFRVHQHPTTGFITQVELEHGRLVAGDFFIDCSGFSSLLLGQAMQVGYESWNSWLPCDRAVAMPCSSADSPAPYTRSTALSAGWQWTIPLRHRVGNGYVFSSAMLSESQAADALLARLPGKAAGEPRILKFTPGRRHKAWEKNVLALGLASGFLEPLESTSLHLVHSGIALLLSLFPDKQCHEVLRREYNQRVALEMERIRDFLILHYKLTERADSEMWRHCAAMTVPDSLSQRMELFKRSGHMQIDQHDLFGAESWLAVHLGQGNVPESCSHLLNMRTVSGTAGLARLRNELRAAAQAMPTHSDTLKQFLGL